MPDISDTAVSNRVVIIGGSSSLSQAARVSGLRVLGMITPASITGGSVWTFQGSLDGTNFFNIFDTAGNELNCGAQAVSQYYQFGPNFLPGLYSIKVRSGTAGAPVVQTVQISLTLVLG